MSHRPRAAAASVVVPLPAEDAWELVTDVRNHVRWIPWTRMHVGGTLRVGDIFTAASGPAWLPGGGLLDRMVVEQLDPPSTTTALPGVAVFTKLGPVLLGSAEMHVRPHGTNACTVTWLETVHLRGLPPAMTAPPLRPVLRAMTRLALRRVAAEVESGPPRTPQRPF